MALAHLVTGMLRLAVVLALMAVGLPMAPPTAVDPGLRDYLALAGPSADLCIPGQAGMDGAAQAHAHACCLIVAAAGPDVRTVPRRLRIAPAQFSRPVERAARLARYPAWQGRAPPVV